MKQRVLLIQPPRLASQPNRMVFPRGLAQIGSFLRAGGWPVAVLPLSYAAVADVTPAADIRSIASAIHRAARLIRQVPSQDFLEHARTLHEIMGLLFDKRI